MLYQLSYAHHIVLPYSLRRRLARPAGLEPATIRLEGGCSIQLSYGRSICFCMQGRDDARIKQASKAPPGKQAVLGKRGAC